MKRHLSLVLIAVISLIGTTHCAGGLASSPGDKPDGSDTGNVQTPTPNVVSVHPIVTLQNAAHGPRWCWLNIQSMPRDYDHGGFTGTFIHQTMNAGEVKVFSDLPRTFSPALVRLEAACFLTEADSQPYNQDKWTILPPPPSDPKLPSVMTMTEDHAYTFIYSERDAQHPMEVEQ